MSDVAHVSMNQSPFVGPQRSIALKNSSNIVAWSEVATNEESVQTGDWVEE